MTDKPKFSPPEPGVPDRIHTGINTLGTIGTIIPVFSALWTPLFAMLSSRYRSPFERRLQRWRETIGEVSSILESRVGDLEKLLSDESFITIVQHASEVAIRTHREEKIQALRNAIINTGCNIDIDEDLQTSFIRYVEELSSSHLMLLEFFVLAEQDLCKVMNYDEIFQTFKRYNPEVELRREHFRAFCQDLTARGLLHILQGMYDSDLGMMSIVTQASDDPPPNVRVTEVGTDFLRYITDHPAG